MEGSIGGRDIGGDAGQTVDNGVGDAAPAAPERSVDALDRHAGTQAKPADAVDARRDLHRAAAAPGAVVDGALQRGRDTRAWQRGLTWL